MKNKEKTIGERPENYDPKDPSIWYNQPKLKEKVEKIKKDFGEPFLITKDGMLLYEHCVVMPCFREQDNEEYEQ